MTSQMQFIWCFCIYLIVNSISAQQHLEPAVDYGQPERLEIGGIEVAGNLATDSRAIISLSGLRVGDPIEVPGAATSRAIRSLWKLQLFSNVEISLTKVVGDVVFLRILVEEQPRIEKVEIEGVKKSDADKLRDKIGAFIRKGSILTADAEANAMTTVRNHFIEKGYSDIKVTVFRDTASQQDGYMQLLFRVWPGRKVKVESITFAGNDRIAARRLRKLLETKTKSRLLTPSRLIPSELEQDRLTILDHYRSLGYLDARIGSDTLWRDEQGWRLHFNLEEGPVYHFGAITWEGNRVYSDERLSRALAIGKGEVFNRALFDTRMSFSPDGSDVSSLYLDHGFLFFRFDAEEKLVRGDTIDVHIRIFEGKPATIGAVVITGNSQTHEEVIRRELRTIPGRIFSRADIIRSQREIINLGFFNPETLDVRTQVNPERGTVDIEYVVEERNNSQFELSAGWGGTGVGLTGTVGVTLNNFSLKELLSGSAWNPFPSGQGQSLSFRVQTNGQAYQSYNLSFTEPWLGGKKPNTLSVAGYYNRYQTGSSTSETGIGQFGLLGLTASLGKRLTWPDDNFIYSAALNFNRYDLQDWSSGLFQTHQGEIISDGNFYNLNLSQTIARSTINAPIFPTAGSRISLTLELTPPYSLFGGGPGNTNENGQPKWIEYHKWRLDAEWYTTLVGKLVLKASAKFGYLGAYDEAIGISPFERFQLGGDGLNNIQGGFTGTDIFALRGYEVEDLENNLVNGDVVATPMFNKLSLELRYPLSLNPNATIFGLVFAEGGNAWQAARDYNPFDLKRSVGAGLRIFLPMFGTLGFDYGIGFDKAGDRTLQNFGKFSIILGFEPK